MSKYIVRKAFTHGDKQYKRGDVFSPEEHGMSKFKVQNRIDAGMIVDADSISRTEAAELTGGKSVETANQPTMAEEVEKMTAEPEQQPSERKRKRNG